MNQITAPRTKPPAISSTSRAVEVAPLTGADQVRLSRLGNALEQTLDGRWQVPDTALLAEDDRHWLETRGAALQRSLVRPHRDAIASVIAAMFLRFGTGPSGEVEGRITAYVADLQSFPLWAIERAVSGLKGQFLPASNIVVDAVRKALEPTQDELAKVRRLLTADVYHVPSDDERARVKARFDLLVAELKLRQDYGDPPRPKSAYATPLRPEEWLAARKADPGPAPMLSAEALRTVGVDAA